MKFEDVRTGSTKRRSKQDERGIALIMVLGTLAILTVMQAEFQEESSTDIAAAASDRDAVQAEYMARSAVNLSRLLIASEPTIRQAIAPIFMLMKKTPPQLPVWEFSDRILGAFNDEDGAKDFSGTLGLDMSLGKNLGLKGGRFELTIVDEDSKINANLGAANEISHLRLARELLGIMARPELNPLFDQRDKSGQQHDRSTICQALIDWADTDEQAFSCDLSSAAPTSAGVEDAYYQLLPKPYRRKNAPFDSLDELHMVRGFSDDFWATLVDPDPTNPRKRVLSVWGQGLVNVNTANAQTLLAVVCSGAPQAEICTDPAQAATFLTGVTMAKGLTMGAPVFGSPKDFVTTMKGQGQIGPLLAAVGMKPVKFLSESEFQKSIATESKMFSIYAVGIVKGYKRETRASVHAVVDFRNAPPLAGPASSAGTSASSTAPPGTAASTTNTVNPSGKPDADAVASALRPSSGGTVVYFRQE